MLKLCVKTIGPYLLELINKSLDTGMYPASWKLAQINPLSKTTQSKSPNGSRPVAHHADLSKLTEKVVQQQLLKFIKAYNLLGPEESTNKVTAYKLPD